MAPTGIATYSAFSSRTQSVEGALIKRRALLVAVGLQATGAVLVIVYAVMNPAGWWVGLAAIAVGTAFTLLALRFGPSLAGKASAPIGPVAPSPADQTVPQAPHEPMNVRGKVRAVVVTFAVSAVVAITAAVVLGLTLSRDREPSWTFVVFAFVAAILPTGIACTVVSFPLQRHLRDIAAGDLARMRRLVQVVFRGKRIDLDAADRAAAPSYAATGWIMQSFNTAGMALFCIAMPLMQLPSLLNPSSPFLRVLAIFVFVLFAVVLLMLPWQIRQIVRARQYSIDHADDARAPVDPQPAA